ncbi:MAG: hypothetical protein A07HB70_01853 [uncultured archaeon A07HB70]|nr:MAG: hypothetical protein A07HB70_01853 [uncultured archaeon A07HB70]
MTTRQFAFLVNAPTDRAAATMNALDHAVSLADAGHEVRVYLDGAGTAWPGYTAENPGEPVSVHYEAAADRGLVVGACGLCAVEFDTANELEREGVPVLGDGSAHSIDTPALAEEGFELVFVS